MADALGWWTLEVTTELDDHDREHIAEAIREGFTSGQIVPDLRESDWTETTETGPVESEQRHVASQTGPSFTRRFTRRRSDGDYDAVAIAVYRLARSDVLGRTTLHAICSDPRSPSESASWNHRHSEVVEALVPDGSDPRALVAAFDPNTIDWDGTPFPTLDWK